MRLDESVGEDAVEDGRKRTEHPRPSRAERGGDVTHDAHGEDGVHRPCDLREEKEDVAVVEREIVKCLP